MTTLEDKIFTVKQNHLVKKMKEVHFLNNLISDSETIIPYPLSCEIINRSFTPYRNIELLSNQQDYEVMVMKDEIKLFENENIIINLPLKKRDDKNYLKIKEQFYIDSINEGQENAIKKILSMND